MFQNVTALVTPPQVNFGTEISLRNMFQGAANVANPIDIGGSTLTNMIYAYNDTVLSATPNYDYSSCGSLYYAFNSCSEMTDCAAGLFDDCPASSYDGAWRFNSLTSESVGNILKSVWVAAQAMDIYGGKLYIAAGSTAPPPDEPDVNAAVDGLRGEPYLWTLTLNG